MARPMDGGRWQGYLSSVVITLGICSHYQINQDIDLGSHLDLSCCQAGCYQSSDTGYRVQTLDVDGALRNSMYNAQRRRLKVAFPSSRN